MASPVGQGLSDDHKAVNDVLEQLLAALRNEDAETSYAKLDLFWARLAVHIRAEHLHLFPAVLNRVSAQTDAAAAPDPSEAKSIVENLRADHEFFMRELARAVDMLRQGQARLNSVLDMILEVEKRLANHNETEENAIYLWADSILTETEQIDLAARIRAELENRPPRFSVDAWVNI